MKEYTTEINLYTDGACKNNPGNGGFAYMLEYNNTVYKYAQGELSTTNNRMELTAVLYAFYIINSIEIDSKLNYTINVYSDSRYVIDAFNKNWLFNWVRKGFLNVKNTDLWQQLYNLVSPLMLMNNVQVNFIWVKGHHTNVNNNIVDRMAQEACGKQGITMNYYYTKS